MGSSGSTPQGLTELGFPSPEQQTDPWQRAGASSSAEALNVRAHPQNGW
jgi:hypothetical protein